MSEANMSETKPQNNTSSELHRIALYLYEYSNFQYHLNLREINLRNKLAAINCYRKYGNITHVFKEARNESSAGTRPGLQALIEAVTSKKVTMVMVTSILDLSPYPPELFRLLNIFYENKCGLQSLNETLLFGDPRRS